MRRMILSQLLQAYCWISLLPSLISQYIQKTEKKLFHDVDYILWIVKDPGGIYAVSNPTSSVIRFNFYLPYQTMILGGNISISGKFHYLQITFPLEGWIAVNESSTMMMIPTILTKPSINKSVLKRWKFGKFCSSKFPQYPSTAYEEGTTRTWQSISMMKQQNRAFNIESSIHCCQECLKHSLCSHWTYYADKSCAILSFSGSGTAMTRERNDTISGSIPKQDLHDGSEPEGPNQLDIMLDCNNSKVDPVFTYAPSFSSINTPIYAFTNKHRLLSPSPFHLQTHPLIGSWDEQWPIGTGAVGAFVGGNIHYEINPVSINNLFVIKPSAEPLTPHSRQYREAKRAYLSGDFQKAESLLSSLANRYHHLGMFQYLFDLTIVFSKHPVRFSPVPSSSAKNCRYNTRKGRVECVLLNLVQQQSNTSWSKGTFQPYKHVLHSESHLDLSAGIVHSSYITRKLKMKKDQLSSFADRILSGEDPEIEYQDQFHYREWFASAIDEVMIGKYRCKGMFKIKENQTDASCLNIALELSQNVPLGNDGVANQILKTFSGNDFLSDHQIDPISLNDSFITSFIRNSFIVHFQLVSSKNSIVPTTSAWIFLLCDNADFTFQEKEFKHMLFICNSATELRIMIVVEKVDNLGLSVQVLEEKNRQESKQIEEKSKNRLLGLLRKGFQAIRSDHIQDIQTRMKAMSFEYYWDRGNTSDPSPSLSCRDSLSNLNNFQAFGKPTEPKSKAKVRLIDLHMMTQLYQYGRYLMLSSGRKSVTNLQGLWADGLRSAWNGDYHLNINMQMNYWSIFQTGVKVSYDPLLEFLHRLVEKGSITASYMYNVATVNQTSVSSSPSLLKYVGITPWVSHGFTDSSLHSFPNGNLEWSLCVTCGAWLATHLHDLFVYEIMDEIDPEVITKILSIYRGAIVFFLQYLFKSRKESTIHSGPTTSPESTNLWLIHNADSEIHFEIPSSLTLSPAIDISVLRQISNQFNLLISWLAASKDKRHLITERDFRLGHEFENMIIRFPNAAIPKIEFAIVDSDVRKALIKEYPDDYLILDRWSGTNELAGNNNKNNDKEVEKRRLLLPPPEKNKNTEEMIVKTFEDIDYGHRHFSSLHWLFPNPYYPFLHHNNNNHHIESIKEIKEEKNILRGKDRTVIQLQQKEADGNIYLAALRTLHKKYEHFGGHTEWSSMWMICLFSRLSNYDQHPTFQSKVKNQEMIFKLFQRFFSRYLSNNFLSLHPKLQINPEVKSLEFAIANNSLSDIKKRENPRNNNRFLKEEESRKRAVTPNARTDRRNRGEFDFARMKKSRGGSSKNHCQQKFSSISMNKKQAPSSLSDATRYKQLWNCVNNKFSCKTCFNEFRVPRRVNIQQEQQESMEIVDFENEINDHVDDSSMNLSLAELNKFRGFEDSDRAKFQIDGNFGYLTAVNELLIQSFLPNILHLFPISSVFMFHSRYLSSSLRGKVEGLRLPGNSRIVRMDWQVSQGKIGLLIVELDLSHFWWRKDGIKENVEEKKYGFYRMDSRWKETMTAEITILSPSPLRVIQNRQEQQQLLEQHYQEANGNKDDNVDEFCLMDKSSFTQVPPTEETKGDYYSTISQRKYESRIQPHPPATNKKGNKKCLIILKE